MNKGFDMRLSRNQRDVLFLLVAFEAKGARGPVPAALMLKAINGQRSTPVAGSNFRAGLKTMVDHGLVLQFRHPTKLSLAYQMTEDGREVGQGIYSDRTQEGEDDEA